MGELLNENYPLSVSSAVNILRNKERIYKRHQIKYKEGMISSMELTQAQSQYINAQAQFIQTMYDVINAKLQLDKLNNKL